MNARQHIHEEVFPATPEQLFALLHTPSAIRGWWGAARAIILPKEGGVWIGAWGEDEDLPDYITSQRSKSSIPLDEWSSATFNSSRKRVHFLSRPTSPPNSRSRHTRRARPSESSRTVFPATLLLMSSMRVVRAVGGILLPGYGITYPENSPGRNARCHSGCRPDREGQSRVRGAPLRD